MDIILCQHALLFSWVFFTFWTFIFIISSFYALAPSPFVYIMFTLWRLHGLGLGFRLCIKF